MKKNHYNIDESVSTSGHVISIKDGVAFVNNLTNIRVGQLVYFVHADLYGMALNLEKDYVGCIVFGDDNHIKQNATVVSPEKLVSTHVGYELLDRVVDGLGRPIDGLGQFTNLDSKNVERKAPGVILVKV